MCALNCPENKNAAAARAQKDSGGKNAADSFGKTVDKNIERNTQMNKKKLKSVECWLVESCISFISFVRVLFRVPATNGKTLETFDALLCSAGNKKRVVNLKQKVFFLYDCLCFWT